MSFSSRVKAELSALPFENNEMMAAECYGMLLFCGKFSPREILLKSESADACRRFESLLCELFSPIIERESDLKLSGKGRRLSRVSLPIPSERTAICESLGHNNRDIKLRINRANLGDEKLYAPFLRGAFLACGSVTHPEKGYHLELNVAHKTLAENLVLLINEVEVFSVSPRITGRNHTYTVYIKGSENVCDFLAYIGASDSVMEVINASVVKEIRNSVNRRNNSDLANLRKVTEAAARQSIAIRKIKKSKLYDELDDGLKQLAELRLENPDMSLKELSESLGISRSGVNHRLERIMKIAESIREENDGKA